MTAAVAAWRFARADVGAGTELDTPALSARMTGNGGAEAGLAGAGAGVLAASATFA